MSAQDPLQPLPVQLPQLGRLLGMLEDENTLLGQVLSQIAQVGSQALVVVRSPVAPGSEVQLPVALANRPTVARIPKEHRVREFGVFACQQGHQVKSVGRRRDRPAG